MGLKNVSGFTPGNVAWSAFHSVYIYGSDILVNIIRKREKLN